MVTRNTGAAVKAAYFPKGFVLLVFMIFSVSLCLYCMNLNWIEKYHVSDGDGESYLVRFPVGGLVCIISNSEKYNKYIEEASSTINEFDRLFEINIGGIEVVNDYSGCGVADLYFFLLEVMSDVQGSLVLSGLYSENQILTFESYEPAFTSILYSESLKKVTRVISIEMLYYDYNDINSNYFFSHFLVQELFHAFSFGSDIVNKGSKKLKSILEENVFLETYTVHSLVNSDELSNEYSSKNSNRLCKLDYGSMAIIYSSKEEIRLYSIYSLRNFFRYFRYLIAYESNKHSGHYSRVISNGC